MTTDPLAPLLDLPGVAEAVTAARDRIDQAMRHRALRRHGGRVAAEVSLRSAVASAALSGYAHEREAVRAGTVTDPVVQGALRVAGALDTLAARWPTAPRQVLARLHVLAARGAVDEPELGRPVGGQPPASWGPGPARAIVAERAGDQAAPSPATSQVVTAPSPATGRVVTAPAVAARLDGLAMLVAGGTRVPPIVLAAVVHGELLALRPFAGPYGVVARAAARLTLISAGADPRGLIAVDVGHRRREPEYIGAAGAFATGTPDGLRAWLRHYAAALQGGAAETMAIADQTLPPR